MARLKYPLAAQTGGAVLALFLNLR